MARWCVYLVRARGGVLYAGITTDLARRLRMHAAGRGAKFLRGRGPLELVYSRKLGLHGLALRVERRLKRLSKADKERLVLAAPTRTALLRRLELPARAPRAPRRRGATSAAAAGARGRSRAGNRKA